MSEDLGVATGRMSQVDIPPDFVAVSAPKSTRRQAARRPRSEFRVALVCMPFASADRPSIQLGLIGACAKQAGFSTELLHFNLELAAALTPRLYELLCERRQHMTGEWLFAPAAFGSAISLDDESYLTRFPAERAWLREIDFDEGRLGRLRHEVLPQFIESCLARADWGSFQVVGFSSLFQQNAASLALARRIKIRFPSVSVVFGGANMEGEMGWEIARAFPFIDHVVSGEADRAFPELLARLNGEQPGQAIGGVISRTSSGLSGGGHAGPITELNDLPVPTYDAYFETAEQLGLVNHYKATWTLPFESSRGCWWGQKHHCTFCGLNGLGMGFRVKSPERTLDELATLVSRYRICSFMAVDNILDLRYVEEVFKPLAEGKVDYNFFYESKANLNRAQIRALYQGGLRRVQPGIESLSSEILSLMHKGCSALQNVQCLKWCRYYGIGVNWNLLWGFPGEREEHYRLELETLKKITHLEPPISTGRIWLERFSPNFNDRDLFPLKAIAAEASYAYVYPPHVDLMKVAYFFDYAVEGTLPDAIHRVTHDFIQEWRAAWNAPSRPSLSYRRIPTGILVDFYFGAGNEGTYSVTGTGAWIYDFCADIRSVNQVQEYLRTCRQPVDHSAEEIRDALQTFCEKGLMIEEDGKYLALALPSNPNW